MSTTKGKIITGAVSYGDRLQENWDEDLGLNTPDKVDRMFRQWAENGVNRIQWRVGPHGGWSRTNHIYGDSIHYFQLWVDAATNFGDWWNYEEECGLRWPIECAHKYGMEIYARTDPFNLGAPPGAREESGAPPFKLKLPNGATYLLKDFAYYSRFCADHPEYEALDRTGKHRHYGILELAYPEARNYLLDNHIEPYLKHYDIDGFCMDTRTECISPLHADRFGFNEPIVEEYQRRYGVNIRESDFDLEAWRSLRGEYFTLFVREISELAKKYKKKFTLLTERGDHLGFPISNMAIDWRTWVKEGLIDDLGIDIRGWCWGRQPYGFITSPNPVEKDVKEVYGPFMKEYNTGLFVDDHYHDGETFLRLAQMAELKGLIIVPWTPRERIDQLKYSR